MRDVLDMRVLFEGKLPTKRDVEVADEMARFLLVLYCRGLGFVSWKGKVKSIEDISSFFLASYATQFTTESGEVLSFLQTFL